MKPEFDSLGAFPPRNSLATSRDAIWAATDDTQSDTSEPLSTNTFNRTRGIWGNPKAPYGNPPGPASISEPSPGNWFGGRGFNQGYPDSSTVYSGIESCRTDRLTPDSDILMRSNGGRRGNRYDSRMNSPQPFVGTFGAFAGPPAQYDSMAGGGMQGGPMAGVSMQPSHGMPMYTQHPQAVGTPLSPYASEFTSKSNWKTEVSIPMFSFLILVVLWLTQIRASQRRARLTCLQLNHLIIDDSSTATSIATGSISWTRSCATMINKLPSSCSRSSR